MDPGYLAAFGGAACYGVGSVLQSYAARRVETAGRIDARLLVRVTGQLPYVVGLGLDLVGFLLSLVAVRRLPLFAVQAILAASVGVTVLLAAAVLAVRPTRAQVRALVVLAAGLVVLAAAAAPERPHAVGGGLTVGLWLAVPVLAAASWYAAAGLAGDRAAAVLGALSGVAFGGTAICARAAQADSSFHALVTDPLVWALLVYGGLGLALFAAALQRGSVTVATACQFAAETVLPAAVGLLVLGDAARPGWALAAGVGFLLTVGAAVGLAAVSPDTVAAAPPVPLAEEPV